MKLDSIVRGGTAAALVGALLVGTAEARNPHCAGGIQYVVQANNDKQKGNMEDYQRELGKAVQQLEQCSTEDPNDFEAIGYLGWAYAESDSFAKAGKAFETAVKGLQAKGDVKKVDWVNNNRNSFWAQSYNLGIGKIGSAQQIYPDFCKTPATDADKASKAEAEKNYRDAATNLRNALFLKVGDVQTTRNLATVYALTCDYPHAEAMLREGLKSAPGDTSLTSALHAVRMNVANQLADAKKYDEAMAAFQDMVKEEPNNADLQLGLADVIFNQAQGLKDDAARKKAFAAAGDAYAKAFELKPTDADLSFNAGVAYQNAQLWDKAEPLWSKTVQLRPNDTEARSSWGACLSELKRCGEAITQVHQAVQLKPQDQNLHRQLGAIYTKCGNNPRGTDELMLYLAMHNGHAVADAAAAAKSAKQGTEAGKTLASEGVPEAVYQWEADNQKFETWFYWGKKRAYAFSDAGALTRKSDWGAPDAKGAGK